jgi:hypothetical protein
MTVVERREIALVDLLDRLLAGGVVITGDVTLRIADVDLVRIDLNALISSVNAQVPSPFDIPGTIPRAITPNPSTPRTEESP